MSKGALEILMLPRVIALIALALLNSPTAPAQSKEHSPDDLLARLSYTSTWDLNEERSPQICFALYRDGYYRMSRKSRKTQGWHSSGPDGTDGLEGTLPRGQLPHLRTLL